MINIKKERLTALLGYLAMVLFSVLFIFIGNKVAVGEQKFFARDDGTEILAAKVDKVISREEDRQDMGSVERVTVTIDFEATVIRGEHKGMQLQAQQINDSFMAVGYKEVEAGDKLLLYGYDDGQETHWLMHEYLRSDALIILAAVFIVLLLIYGRKKGFHSVLALGFTCLSIFLVFIPAILSGKNIYAASFILMAFITVMTLTLVNGFNRKSLSAGIGLFGGLAAAAVVFGLADIFLKLSGYVSEESIYLAYVNPANPIDLKAILFAGILLGALGAVMDVAVSIAASLQEVHDSAENPTFASLMRSGLNIGQDMLGTMMNTLVLAYIGSSLSLVLILIVYSNSLLELFNKEMIVVEVLQSLAGSVGLLAAIPLTTLVSSYIYIHKRKS